MWDEIPMIEGYAMITGAMNYDGWLQFSGVTMKDGGYVKQEVERIIKNELRFTDRLGGSRQS